jgi:hypothetical protein
MQIYKLTGEGKKWVKIPGQYREEILDHLYEFGTARREELLALDKEALTKLAKFKREGLVMEVT